jgi:hypothetical protein
MKRGKIRKHLFAASAMFMLTSTVLANPPSDLVCPTAEEIQAYQSIMAFPYGYENASDRVKFIDMALNTSTFDLSAKWTVVMSPLLVKQTDDVHATANNTIHSLVPVSATPFKFSVLSDLVSNGDDDEEINWFCVYKSTLPGDVSAIAYYDVFGPDEAEPDAVKKVMKLARNFLK